MHGIFYMVMVSIFCTAIALILFAKGVNMIGPTSASILSTLEPIVGIVASFLVLKEPLSWQIIFGSALVIASVMLITLQGGGDEVLP
jgi:drug/metabolite transporter (DMT)-like permease